MVSVAYQGMPTGESDGLKSCQQLIQKDIFEFLHGL
ncbi:MAG: hypothetical protein RLY70_4052 [Planctomycetota bacterium]